MTNREFYNETPLNLVIQKCEENKYKSLNKFLDAEHTWSPKYNVGDIVRTTNWSNAEVIVKVDYENDKYVCIGLKHIAKTLLPNYYEDGCFNDSNDVTSDAGGLYEDEIVDKVGELVVSNQFFGEIAKCIVTNQSYR